MEQCFVGEEKCEEWQHCENQMSGLFSVVVIMGSHKTQNENPKGKTICQLTPGNSQISSGCQSELNEWAYVLIYSK
jgi:hypothetical protein